MRRVAIVVTAIATLVGCSSGKGTALPAHWLGGCLPEGTPLNFLDRPAHAEKGTDGAAQALRKFIAKPIGASSVLAVGWRRAGTGSSVTFIAPFVPEGPVTLYTTTTTPHTPATFVSVTFAKKSGKWKYQGSSFGCTPIVERRGSTGVDWALDPAAPTPTADTTAVPIVVRERACTSATPIGDRLLAPEISYGPSAVTVRYYARPLTLKKGQAFNCPAIPAEHATLHLAQPLGSRELLDGTTVQPRPPTADSSWMLR